MFCNIMFWVLASELINFEIKYPYMYFFERSCNTCKWQLSNMLSMLGMAIIPHLLTSASRILLSTLSLK